jgi:hypothetical protein
MPGIRAPRICIDGDREWPIVVAVGGPDMAQIRANERLIAAAPEMYEMLKRQQAQNPLHRDCADGSYTPPCALCSLISKAEGTK